MHGITHHRRGAILLLLLTFLCSSWGQSTSKRCIIDLSGTWNFALDPQEKGEQEKLWNVNLSENVVLPGTTDTNRKGKENTNKSETTFLSRYYKYEGAAWYSRNVEIPADWEGKHMVLFLERTRPTTVWIDDREVGKNNYLSTPQEYDLSHYLSPGLHKLTIRVDNGKSIPGQIRSSSHACTESTQTNWNGMIGRMELQAMNPLFIESVQTFPQPAHHSVKVKVTLSKADGIHGKKLQLSASAFNTTKNHRVKAVEYELKEGCREYEFDYQLGEKALMWSDLQPALYQLRTEINGIDEKSVSFGLRIFRSEGTHFTINGVKTFLRGKHDACVFPLTGYTAMDLEQWRRYFRICKEYGLNHCRFHSWCPPAACFEAADLEGVYLQPELPIWGGFNKESVELMDFLMKDGENIMRTYSNHPSFVLFALGNELGGDIDIMKRFVNSFRAVEPRHLYTYGSNIFLGSRGHIPGEDFLVTCRVGSGEGYSTHARASFSFADAEEGGYLNHTYPNLVMNFDEALKKSQVPVIGHETGQYQIYPNYKEMEKYTGVLAPWNFEIFRKRLEEAGMSNQAEDFLKASGAWSVELYRADIEMNLRSGRMAGFQLLDLQDYPGQGSAYVGILDAFMDSKGLIEPRKWREFCSEVVPLLVTPKFCWTGQEAFTGDIKIANYGGSSLKGQSVVWELKNDKKTLRKGKMIIPAGEGLLNAGAIHLTLPNVEKACKAELSLKISGTAYQNSYPLWIYPVRKKLNPGEVMVARQLTDSLLETLKQGGKVLLMPYKEECNDVTVGGLFQTDYWNYRMFKSICDRIKKPASPGTLGILTDPGHPVFADFPTEYHTNWQWYSIIKNSYPLILDRMPKEYRPLVQVIDNVERNHRLGLVFELKVEGGKLLVCMADPEAVRNTPEGSQFYASLLEYMNSPNFKPTTSVSVESFKNLFIEGTQSEGIKVLNNISYD
ncbi:sugar-binding domain-containing protein [Bacteroides sp.]|uniref:sugar-binding domain-containing protein n=1 Tax=Bacteroides sp. TaxID=29523 RepID=UPI00261D726B|nr:sugar-binding domain-containing protein [Bacteroides sp.]MDD3036934.1 beta-glycosidase [Bacteroides sp.]